MTWVYLNWTRFYFSLPYAVNIFSFISVYLLLNICYNRNTRLRHSTWWEPGVFSTQSKYTIVSGRKEPPVFYNKSCFKNFAIFIGKYLCWSLFLIRNFKATLLKETQTQVFSCVFKITCFEKHMRTAGSIRSYFLISALSI